MKTFYMFYFYLNKLFKLAYDDTSYEDRFQKDFLKNHVQQNKITIYINLSAHTLFLIVNYFLVEKDFIFNLIVYSTIVYTSNIIFLFKVDNPSFQKNLYFYLFLVGAAIGGGTSISIIFTETNYSYYIINTMLLTFAVYIMYGIPFSIATLLFLMVYITIIIVLLFSDILFWEKLYHLFVLFLTATISIVSGYLMEKRERSLYAANYNQEELNKELVQKENIMHQQARLAQMGELISMIAHQWRQPISAISSCSNNMKLKILLENYDLNNEDERKELYSYFNEKLDSIDSFVKSLSTTINDFRNFYKPNTKKTISNITGPIRNAISIMEHSLNTNNIQLKEQFEYKGEIEIHESELMQVVLNILKNAQDNFLETQATKPEIVISTLNIDNGVVIEIYNNGGAIPEEIIERIFDPYFSTKNEKNGTGLGLYMSKIIVEEHHNGKLEVNNLDGGVVFSITLYIFENEV